MSALPFEWVDPDSLVPMINMRLNKDDEADYELKADIALRGIQQNMKIRTNPKEGELDQVYIGRRRLHAAQTLKAEGVGKGSILTGGEDEVIVSWVEAPILCPTIREEVDDQEAYLVTMSENVNRKDVSDMEVGNWINLMIMKFNLSATDIARSLGKSRSWASRKLDFYKTIQDTKAPMPESERQFRAYSKLPKTVQDLVQEEHENTGIWPSARDMEVHGLPSVNELLSQYTPEQVRSGEIDKEFLTHILLENKYKFNEAKAHIEAWLLPRKTGPKMPGLQKNVYTVLGVYYTPNVLDSVFAHHDSEHQETLTRYARRLTGALMDAVGEEKVEKIWMQILS